MKGTKTICILSAFALSMAATLKTDACTNIIVTKGASADGSVLVSYAADSHALFGELYFAPAADWKSGATRKIYDWDSGRYLGEIPQPAHTYKRVGNMNEHQLIIAETTFGGRSELHDRNGGIDYGSLIYVALERCKTAREAITLMTDLANEYGYYSDGESFTIADKNEVWVMEMIGKGMVMKNGVNLNKGVVWVARRIPDGYICAHANQARITTFPLKDPENCRYSPDVITFAKKKGYYDGPDDEFSFADAYCPLDFGGMRACEARVWSAFNILSNGWFTSEDENGRMVTKDAYTYIDYAMGYSTETRMPLYIQPAKKLTVKDIADVMRDHYEGTPLDMTADMSAGPWGMPVRPRPMNYTTSDGNTYFMERPIGTQQSGFTLVSQLRSFLPDAVGGIMYFNCDDASMIAYVPVYCCVNQVPAAFRPENNPHDEFDENGAFWMCNFVANMVYPRWSAMIGDLREAQDELENFYAEDQKEVEARARELTAGECADYLTAKTIDYTDRMMKRWDRLARLLIVKHNDQIMQPSENGAVVPGRRTSPEYAPAFIDAVKDNTGNRYIRP